ncbi:hypothetical protein HUA74_18355 [Myxococcus sp. CA051A]|uniref:hypothetical protein n=1 Tax=Myxococcus sp. CA051A TaxID=2741739 RepID=UPI00157A68CF|nr:hypothetical protein [Myxococcus sp. CA051A]NTX62619.1 hypothetical protein [Myxococcus sp. CA051A]
MLQHIGKSEAIEYGGGKATWLNLDCDAILIAAVGTVRTQFPVKAIINDDAVHPRLLHAGALERIGGRIWSVQLVGLQDGDKFDLWAETAEYSAPRSFPALDNRRSMMVRHPTHVLVDVVVESAGPTLTELTTELTAQWWDGLDTDLWVTGDDVAPFLAQAREPGFYTQCPYLPLDVSGYSRVAVAVELVALSSVALPDCIIKPTVDLFAQLSTTRPYASIELGSAPDVGVASTTYRNESDGFALTAVHTLLLGGAGGANSVEPDTVVSPMLPVGIAVRLACTGNEWMASEFASGQLTMRIRVTGY